MNRLFRTQAYGSELTLAQLWKAKKAAKKLVKSNSKRENPNKKKAA